MKYINSRLGRTRNGFTLIELLVVIAIIALLLSIMMPSLSKARQLAKRVMCLGNMKQMGLGITMYSHNWDGKYPPQTWRWPKPEWPINYFTAWRDPLLPYFDNDDGIFRCPVGKKRWGKNCYRMNPPPIPGGQANSWKLTDFGAPGSFVLVQDYGPVHSKSKMEFENQPQLFGDTHAEVGLWIDVFHEGFWNTVDRWWWMDWW